MTCDSFPLMRKKHLWAESLTNPASTALGLHNKNIFPLSISHHLCRLAGCVVSLCDLPRTMSWLMSMGKYVMRGDPLVYIGTCLCGRDLILWPPGRQSSF